MNTWIKICGLTRPDNALECALLEPDAIGLVFYEKSPRNVSINQAKDICSSLPGSVSKIGVFVDKTYEQIIKIVELTGLTGVQLHGNESPALVDKLIKKNLIVIKALFAAREPFLEQAKEFNNASYLLIEYGKGILPGGNAESWDYELSLKLKTTCPVILAGGLDSGNVVQAIRSVQPAGVDISSNVEKKPGVKDLKKVKSFIQAARSANY